MDKLMKYIWLALAIVALIGVIFYGAIWHIPTAIGCMIMYAACRSEEPKRDRPD